MNIDAIVSRTKKYDYLNRVEAELKLIGLQLNDLKTYERIGRSNYGKTDTIYKKRFGEASPIPEHHNFCLCGHRIKEQCYLCPAGSNKVNDILVVGNHCIKTWGFERAVIGNIKNKIKCDLCNAMVCRKGIARHKRRPCCINNRKVKADNETESTNSGGSSND